MASQSELSLECKPHSYSMLLKSFGDQNYDKTQKLEEYLACLEEERIKIDAFRRELPLCMQLLNNALNVSRHQLLTCKASEGEKPVLEEFMPLKHSSSDCSDKTPNNSGEANWITNAQLWNQANDMTKEHPAITSPKETDSRFNVSTNLALDVKQRNGGGAFLPLSKDQNSSSSLKLDRVLPDLTLRSGNKEMEEKKCMDAENGISCPMPENCIKLATIDEQEKGTGISSQGQATSSTTSNTNSQPHRKPRRCWSPDLHRRFVNALHMLGGSQVATPKQIRELMKVDGLTNDEVKSHLQKYRLHTRRPSLSSHAAAVPPTPLVVLGGIWLPPEYTASANQGSTAAYYGGHAAPHATPNYCATPVGQDFYTAAPQLMHPTVSHQQLLRQQVQFYNAASQTQSSQNTVVRVGRDRSESIEDGKSDSGSLREESSENAEEQKETVARRGEC